jgi:hypothetical protein
VTPEVADLDVERLDALMIAGGLASMWTLRDHEALKQQRVRLGARSAPPITIE